MKYCANCQTTFIDSYVKCPKCGQILQTSGNGEMPRYGSYPPPPPMNTTAQKNCSNCHQPISAHASYCSMCGAKQKKGLPVGLIILFAILGLVVMAGFVFLLVKLAGNLAGRVSTGGPENEETQEHPTPRPTRTPRTGLQPTETPSNTITATPMPTATIAVDNYDDMIFIPGDSFIMGASENGMEWHLSSCNTYDDCDIVDFDDMVPAHLVEIDSFYIDAHEVTNSDYRQCVEAGVCPAPDQTAITKYLPGDYYLGAYNGQYPVVGVTYYDAATYCNWDGAKQLPTEAQWEFAAKGVDGDYFPWTSYPTGLSAHSVFGGSQPLANFCDANCSMQWKDEDLSDGYEGPAPVMSFVPGPNGLYDMSGNVTEWIRDYYRKDYYSVSPIVNPYNTSVSEWRVTRGGGWNNGIYYLSSVFRSAQDPDKATAFLGFRCVK